MKNVIHKYGYRCARTRSGLWTVYDTEVMPNRVVCTIRSLRKGKYPWLIEPNDSGNAYETIEGALLNIAARENRTDS